MVGGRSFVSPPCIVWLYSVWLPHNSTLHPSPLHVLFRPCTCVFIGAVQRQPQQHWRAVLCQLAWRPCVNRRRLRRAPHQAYHIRCLSIISIAPDDSRRLTVVMHAPNARCAAGLAPESTSYAAVAVGMGADYCGGCTARYATRRPVGVHRIAYPLNYSRPLLCRHSPPPPPPFQLALGCNLEFPSLPFPNQAVHSSHPSRS